MADQRSDFWLGLVTGAVVGGTVGGILGAVLASRLETKPKRKRSASLLGQGNAADVTMFDEVYREADEAIAKARQELESKIEQVRAQIDETRSRLSVADHPAAKPESAPTTTI
ncbi:MAG: hypothetical protein HC926_00960 [Synechococcaceae cyanobacterium SM2_3_60]|nr:hypothetical protein [Synechococcaceae cyanobacterium SM2_3_60]